MDSNSQELPTNNIIDEEEVSEMIKFLNDLGLTYYEERVMENADD
jgi:hypothetical protein